MAIDELELIVSYTIELALMEKEKGEVKIKSNHSSIHPSIYLKKSKLKICRIHLFGWSFEFRQLIGPYDVVNVKINLEKLHRVKIHKSRQ